MTGKELYALNAILRAVKKRADCTASHVTSKRKEEQAFIAMQDLKFQEGQVAGILYTVTEIEKVLRLHQGVWV
jgi:hypothetical protein